MSVSKNAQDILHDNSCWWSPQGAQESDEEGRMGKVKCSDAESRMGKMRCNDERGGVGKTECPVGNFAFSSLL